ncbi:helix-turn-helix domain-containing protein [Geodermatophilus sp. SYSU D00815]
MVTVLDSRTLDAPDRRPAALVARLQEGVASRVRPVDDAVPLDVRLDAWDVHGLPVLGSAVDGELWMEGRRPGADVVSLYVQDRGTGRHEQGGLQRSLAPGELAVTDLTAPYAFSWGRHGGRGRALQVPAALLGLPADVVRRAAPRVRRSPLYDLVRGHLRHVADERLARDPALGALAGVTVELTRALLASAAGPEPATRAALAGTLLPRVRAYVRAHLREPDLDAARVAAAHNVSVRQLYRLCAAEGLRLEPWIIEQRLAGARAELADPAARHRSIAMVARRWGFADPSHFSRRFREAYGLSPRDWRAAVPAGVG